MNEDNPSARDEAYAASRVHRDRALQAMHALEAALAKAAEGAGWQADVVAALRSLEMAMEEEQRELHRPDALLSLIAAERPRRHGARIRSLREQYDDIARQLTSLLAQLGHPDDLDADARDLRHRAGWIIRALQDCRARQTDLVFEALERDLGDAGSMHG